MSRTFNPEPLVSLRWVKLKKYCELSGDTQEAVKGRRKRGIWLDGKQCKRAPDGKLWVSLQKVQEWVEKT